MAIKWTEKMSIGSAAIDNDHKHLIDLINIIEETLNRSDGCKNLIEAMNDLELYTKNHFKREEQLQHQINYKLRFQHFKHHHELRNKFKQIKNSVFNEINEFNEVRDINALTDILKHWLLDHVLNEDMLMKPHLLKMTHGLNGRK